MTNPVGFVLPAATIGLGALLLRPRRGFYSPKTGAPIVLPPQAVLTEQHTDQLEITEHPVEQGAAIADHAFKRPSRVIITCLWSNSPSTPGGLISQGVSIGATLGGPVVGVAASLPSTIAGFRSVGSILSGNAPNQVKEVYAKLLELQAARGLFDVFTGKRKYVDMLFEQLDVMTDERHENSLLLVVVCRQVIIATTQLITVPINVTSLSNPGSNTPRKELGTKQLIESPDAVLP